MPRKKKMRRINYEFPNILYKPAGVPGKQVEIVCLGKDEMEALRLVYLEGLSMLEGAEKMGISAPTFNRIVNSAVKKLVKAVILGKGFCLE